MKKNSRDVLTIVLITFVMIFYLLLNNSFAQEEEILTGVIKAIDWHNGEVIAAVLVVTNDEEDEEGKLTTYIDEYMILDNRIGQQVFKLDGETVEITGVFLEEDDGTIFLKVKSYRIIQSNDDEINEEDKTDEYPIDDELEEPPL